MSRKSFTKKRDFSLSRAKSMDLVSWVMVITLVLLAVGFAVGGIFYYLGFKEKKHQEYLDTMTYYDEDLNFSILLPENWGFARPQADAIKKLVDQVNRGVLWDMSLHKLPHEVVPLVFIKLDGTEDTQLTEDKLFVESMTLMFRGFQEKDDPIWDQLKLMDDFKSVLTEIGLLNVEIVEVADLAKVGDPFLEGTVVKARASIADGTKVNFMQYYELVGKNVLIVTVGTKDDFDIQLSYVRELLKGLLFHRGGVLSPERLERIVKEEQQETQPDESSLGTDINPDPDVEYVPYEDIDESQEESTDSTTSSTNPPASSNQSGGIDVRVDSLEGDISIRDSSGSSLQPDNLSD